MMSAGSSESGGSLEGSGLFGDGVLGAGTTACAGVLGAGSGAGKVSDASGMCTVSGPALKSFINGTPEN